MKKTAKMIKEKKNSEESGYVVAMTALMLVPMLVMAAFAVDVGSWYSDAARLQRAADAAALAAVVHMPDEDEAWAVALEVAEQNGFVSNYGVNNAFIGGGNSRLRFEGEGAIVNIRIEAEGELYFAQAFLNDVQLARTSQAEYIEEVRMGNPTSGLGLGDLTDPDDVGMTLQNDGFWLAATSQCEQRVRGDQHVRWVNGCSGGTINPIGALPIANGGDGFNGYTFVIDMPATATAAELEIRHPGFCDNSRHGPFPTFGQREPDLTAYVYGPDISALTANDVLDVDALKIAEQTWAGDVYGGANGVNCGWHKVADIPASSGTRQLFYARFEADTSDGNSSDHNLYSLRVRPTGVQGLCSSLADGTCPQLYALDWLPIWRSEYVDGAGDPITTAEFFLANIESYHEGKILELTMFDPGEGMQEIRILKPDGSYAEFDYRIADNSVLESGTDGTFNTTTSTGCENGDHCLDVTASKYNGHALQLQMDLDPYDCHDLGGGNVNCWWKIEYYAGSNAVKDRTNWSVRIIGDPIRLTE